MAVPRDRQGRPTQLHGVPLEERAIDANGNRLPWAYDYPDDHPQARYQKRQPEEKGAFGKSSRRLGSSRATRTQTPARKENTTIDGFTAALKYDQKIREAEGDQSATPVRSGTDPTKTGITTAPAQPQQVLLYGFPAEFQWSALSFYERVSGGLICEDYPRDPPAEKRRYDNSLGSSITQRRTLTPAERALASQYHGGESWIVVTFDSREAADRAIAASPHAVNGYWAFAEAWRGVGPNKDVAIAATEEAARAKSTTMRVGPISKKADSRTISATLPRDFTGPNDWLNTPNKLDSPTETSTVTSATATAIDDEPDQVRQRKNNQLIPQEDQSQALTPAPSKTHFSHFPTTPRTIIKPATQALLPQPSYVESAVKSLSASGWIPGDPIGASVPRKADGTFDQDVASIYWRFWFWIDSMLGTDLCGLKDD